MQSYHNQAAFVRQQFPDDAMAAYRAGFASVAEQTPDLHLYRLIQIFNTPLLNIPLYKANDFNYSFWKSIGYKSMPAGSTCHIWTFQRQECSSLVIPEFRFDGLFSLHSPTLSVEQLAEAHQQVCQLVQQD